MAGDISITVVGASEWSAAIDEMIAKAEEAAEEVVTRGGELVKAAIQGHAPVKTGTLRRSVSVGGVMSLGAGAWSSQVGPTTAYGRRVDLGFKGKDSLGRLYNQSGQPFVEQGLADSASPLEALYTSIFAAALEG